MTLDIIKAIRTNMNERFRDRSDIIECMLASLLTGELMLLIGPRGEAKTAIVEAFSQYIDGGTHFSVGLAKSSTPDDILGAVDILAMQNGVYRRNTDGFLPTATTFLLDEGFKSNNPTLQAMLRVLSEREYQGSKINALFGAIASNELPSELRGQRNGKSADLGPFEDSLLAFFDRFYYKMNVPHLECATQNWIDVVFDNAVDKKDDSIRITVEQIHAMREQVKNVVVGDNIRRSIADISLELAGMENPVRVSTRTWRKSINAIKAHAFLNARNKVTAADLGWLQFALWTTPDQIPQIASVVSEVQSPVMTEVMALSSISDKYLSAYDKRCLTVGDGTQDDAFGISSNPVSHLAHSSIQEAFTKWLGKQVIEVRALMTSGGEEEEEANNACSQLIAKLEDGRKKVMTDILNRLQSM